MPEFRSLGTSDSRNFVINFLAYCADIRKTKVPICKTKQLHINNSSVALRQKNHNHSTFSAKMRTPRKFSCSRHAIAILFLFPGIQTKFSDTLMKSLKFLEFHDFFKSYIPDISHNNLKTLFSPETSLSKIQKIQKHSGT